MTIALQYVSALIAAGDAKVWLKNTQAGGYFRPGAEEQVREFVAGFITSYGKTPPTEIVEQETGVTLPVGVPEHPEYYLEKLRQRYVTAALQEAGNEAGKLLSGDTKDPDAALDHLATALTELRFKTNQQSLVGLKEAFERVIEDWNAKIIGTMEKGVGMGWESLDVDGGLDGGDLGSIVGRPATGKTWFTLYVALHMWRVHGRSVLLSTQEMPAGQIAQRLLAMHAGLPVDPLNQALPYPLDQEEQLIEAVKNLNTTVPFHILDSKLGGTCSDLEAFARSLDAEALVIDGAYLLKHPDGNLNRYQRVAENCDLIKDMLLRMNIPGVASWQFGRDAAKKMKKTKGDNMPDVEDIGYSDAIGQHSSIILALLQTESIETAIHRNVSVIKGRSGQSGEFKVNWDFLGMDFSEIENKSDLSPVPEDAMTLIG